MTGFVTHRILAGRLNNAVLIKNKSLSCRYLSDNFSWRTPPSRCISVTHFHDISFSRKYNILKMPHFPTLLASNTAGDYDFGSYLKQKLSKRCYTTENPSSKSKDNSDNTKNTNQSLLIYEGPFSSLSLRLKRVSISSAIVSIVGIPLLIFINAASADVPMIGQLAVGSTAIIAATGSTVALNFCFSPYVNKLEWITTEELSKKNNDENNTTSTETDGFNTPTDPSNHQKKLLKATTSNIFSFPVVTIFDPDTQVEINPKTYRPFCNFIVKSNDSKKKDVLMFVHPELIHDDQLRTKLVGNLNTTSADEKNVRKNDDDEFL